MIISMFLSESVASVVIDVFWFPLSECVSPLPSHVKCIPMRQEGENNRQIDEERLEIEQAINGDVLDNVQNRY